MSMPKKMRLDVLVQEQQVNLSRNQIQSLIVQGKVLVDGIPCTKAGTLYGPLVSITLTQEVMPYVSRAGFKIEKALKEFDISVQGLIALDAGISTGGFTDCLLQNNVLRVYGVDVGYGQVHERIRNDPRLVLLERTNLRYLKSLPELVDIVTLDLSFISVLKVMSTIKMLIKPMAKLIILIKPQFEANREDIGRGGIIKDDAVHTRIITMIREQMTLLGFLCKGIIESPIRGAQSGNKEFLAYFTVMR